MLAIDHGYFQGPTTGLERIDVTIVPLIAHADALMVTRGLCEARSCGDRKAGRSACQRWAEHPQGAIERADRGRLEDAIRVNASALAVQVYIGGEYEHQSIGNLVKVVDSGNRYGIPTMAVTGVGKELAGDAKYLGLATRMCAEWEPTL